MKGGINFEEWKEIVKKNRRSLRSKSNSFKFEPESLTYGAEKAVKSPEYGQVHTITYNVTGVDVPSSWPTEIKSGKTLTLNNIQFQYGSDPRQNIVQVNSEYTFENGTLIVNNVQSDLIVTITSGNVYYNGAKVGDYLYSDYTFGPTEKPGYIGRCVCGQGYDSIQPVIFATVSSFKYKWSTEEVDTPVQNVTLGSDYSYSTEADITNGKSNTDILISLGTDKYPAASWAFQQFKHCGYLPSLSEIKTCFAGIKQCFSWTSTDSSTWSSTEMTGMIGNELNTQKSAGSVNYYKRSYLQGFGNDINATQKQIALRSISFWKPHGSDIAGTPPVYVSNHDYVDLGLPSGRLWATMNVGASSVGDTGLYFQACDTQGYTAEQVGSGSGQKYFGWADYKYGNGSDNPSVDDITKYNRTDGKEKLDVEDDGVFVNWGGPWKLPKDYDFGEVLSNTTQTWVNDYEGSGIKGYLFTSNTDPNKKLFMPCCGYCKDGERIAYNDSGHYLQNGKWDTLTWGRDYIKEDTIIQGTGIKRNVGCSLRGVID